MSRFTRYSENTNQEKWAILLLCCCRFIQICACDKLPVHDLISYWEKNGARFYHTAWFARTYTLGYCESYYFWDDWECAYRIISSSIDLSLSTVTNNSTQLDRWDLPTKVFIAHGKRKFINTNLLGVSSFGIDRAIASTSPLLLLLPLLLIEHC